MVIGVCIILGFYLGHNRDAEAAPEVTQVPRL